MSELKPCPFCGGEAELVYSEPGHEDRIWCIVRCKDWNCPGEHLNEWYATDDDAIGKWNTRYERTCDIEDWFDHGDDVTFDLSCGHSCFLDRDDLPLVYCYKCGAKVMKE